ncbi:MAG TPA: hypothetical protein VHR41_06730 [Gemmatimonadales bacterium]|jgi:hypothetical protein|nr:hypothetical protein [Gemmatimonadales bacterium]
MSLYSIAVFLHVVGALGIFAAIGLEWTGLTNLRRAAGTTQVREWLRLLAAPRTVGGPSALLILASGIYMSATRWGPQAWILVALGGMVVVAAVGGAVGGRRAAAIARALPAEGGSLSPTLRQQVNDPALIVSLWTRSALLLGIVFLMSVRPSWGGALAVMGIALVLGIALSRPALGAGRRAAQVARSER